MKKRWGVIMARGPLKEKWLKGPRTPAEVKRGGYAFTDNEAEAWPFLSEAQAKRKAEIVSEHMQAFATHVELTNEEGDNLG